MKKLLKITNKFKFFLTIFLFSTFILSFSNLAWAADSTVTCPKVGGGCDFSGDNPIFQEANIFPGWSKTKTLKAINNYSEDRVFSIEALNFSPSELSDVLTITIKKSGELTNIYQDNLTNFKNQGFLTLSSIPAVNNLDYDLTVAMQGSADNDYQAKTTKFDLNLGFDTVASGPTPTPGPGPTATPGPCSSPASPTNLTATPVSSTVIRLDWVKSADADHYSISYGLESGKYIYGADNIGNVNTYTVSDLSSGTTYYFIVSAVNGCGSASSSNEASAGTGGVLGAFINNGPAIGFQNILGASTEATPSLKLKNELPVAAGETKGAKTSKPVCFWWLIVLICEAVILGLYYFKKEKQSRLWFLIAPILVILGFLVDKFFHQWYIPSYYCRYVILIGIIISLIESVLFIWKSKKKQ